MPVLPSTKSFWVLLAWSEAVETKRGWLKLDPSQVPALAGMTAEEIQGCVSELTRCGYCTPAAHGDLVYITAEGAKLARTARDLIDEGAELAELTLDALVPKLPRSPVFRLPHPLTQPTGIRPASPPLAVR